MNLDDDTSMSFLMFEDENCSVSFNASIDSSLTCSSSFSDKYHYPIDFGSNLSTIVIDSNWDDDSNFTPTISAKTVFTLFFLVHVLCSVPYVDA